MSGLRRGPLSDSHSSTCLVSLALSLILALNCAPMAGAVVSSSDAQAYYQSIITHKDRNENVDSYLIDFDGDGREELLLVWDVWSSTPNGNTIHYEVWQGANCLTSFITGHPSVCFATGTKRGNSGKLYLIDEYPGWSSTITKIYTVVDGTWKLVEDLYSQHGYETVWKIDGKQCTQSEYESRHALYSVGKQYQPDANASVEMELLNSMEASNGDDTTNAMAEAYLNVVDQQVQRYGGYAQKGAYEWTNGVIGGLIRDFDQNGVPELFLWSVEEPLFICEGLWTWDGNRAKQLYDGEVAPAGHYGGSEIFYDVNGKLYRHIEYMNGSYGWFGASGEVYGIQNGEWKEVLSYSWFDYDEQNISGYTDGYNITQNGISTEMSKSAFFAKLEKYKSNDSIEVLEGMGFQSIHVPVKAQTLRTQLSQLAANQPSSWAKAEVEAAKAAGLKERTIVFKHILPHTLTPLILSVSMGIGGAILSESGLSYLGLGVQEPVPSWGAMIAGGQDYVNSAPWLSLFPGIMITLTVLSLCFIGEAFRQAIDPRAN